MSRICASLIAIARLSTAAAWSAHCPQQLKTKAEAQSADMPTYPATNRRKPASRIGACRQNRSPEAVPTRFARVVCRNCRPDKADAHMGRAEKGRSRTTMTELRYLAPNSLDEAISAFAAAGSAGRILAGGTDLLVQMRAGVVKPGLIVDIKKIAEMTAIEETADGGFRDRRRRLRHGAARPCRASARSGPACWRPSI